MFFVASDVSSSQERKSNRYLDSFDKAHSAVREIEAIGEEIARTLAVVNEKSVLLSDENVASTSAFANALIKMK